VATMRYAIQVGIPNVQCGANKDSEGKTCSAKETAPVTYPDMKPDSICNGQWHTALSLLTSRRRQYAR